MSRKGSLLTLNQCVGGSIYPRLTEIRFRDRKTSGWRRLGRVAELADALDLGSSTERCAGSSPASPTIEDRRANGECESNG